MAKVTPKTTTQTETEPLTNGLSAEPVSNLEDMLADSLLEAIDWQAVKALMIGKAKTKFWQWVSSQVASGHDVSLALLPDAIAIGASEVSNDI